MQMPIDSLATALGGGAGTAVTAALTVGLGYATKLVTDLVLKIKNLHDRLPARYKPFVAFAVAIGLVTGNDLLASSGMPAITGLESIPYVVAWVASMGIHSLISVFRKAKK